jgi:hypothetical protein
MIGAARDVVWTRGAATAAAVDRVGGGRGAASAGTATAAGLPEVTEGKLEVVCIAGAKEDAI